MGQAIRYFLSCISSPCSKYRVAVTVDQIIIANATTPPNAFLRSANSDSNAKNEKGSKEQPNMLIVL